MKILQLVTKRQYRGAEVFASTLTEDLVKHGHEVYFLGIYQPPASPLSPKANHIGDLRSTRYITRLKELSTIIKTFNPDIIQANGSITLQFAVFSRLWARSSARVVYRNISLISAWMTNPLKKWIYTKIFGLVDMVVSVSDESRLDFIKTMSFPETKIKTIKRGVDVPNESSELTSGPDGGIPYILHVGSFTPEKNHMALLRIFEQLIKVYPDISLVCLGEGALQSHFEQQAKAKHLDSKITIAGFQKDTNSYYRSASVLVLTSSIEGIPGVILEAAAQGVPSVAFHVGGIGEVVNNGVTGYLIASGNEDDFVAAILKLLGKESTRNEMGRNAFEFVKVNHNRNTQVGLFIEMYGGLIAR